MSPEKKNGRMPGKNERPGSSKASFEKSELRRFEKAWRTKAISPKSISKYDFGEAKINIDSGWSGCQAPISIVDNSHKGVGEKRVKHESRIHSRLSSRYKIVRHPGYRRVCV